MIVIDDDLRGCIGVFDSGLGGISILGALVRELPCEDFVYFGDSANAPYGTKDMSQVRRSCRNASGSVFGDSDCGS